MKRVRKLSAAQLLLLSELADFSPVKRTRPNGYTSRRGAFFGVQNVTSCAVRGLLEILHENPARVILTDAGRAEIGLRASATRGQRS